MRINDIPNWIRVNNNWKSLWRKTKTGLIWSWAKGVGGTQWYSDHPAKVKSPPWKPVVEGHVKLVTMHILVDIDDMTFYSLGWTESGSQRKGGYSVPDELISSWNLQENQHRWPPSQHLAKGTPKEAKMWCPAQPVIHIDDSEVLEAFLKIYWKKSKFLVSFGIPFLFV